MSFESDEVDKGERAKRIPYLAERFYLGLPLFDDDFPFEKAPNWKPTHQTTPSLGELEYDVE